MPSLDGAHDLDPRIPPTLAAAAALLLAMSGVVTGPAGLDPARAPGRCGLALAERAPAQQPSPPPAAPEPGVADARDAALVRAGCVVLRVLAVAAGRAGLVAERQG